MRRQLRTTNRLQICIQTYKTNSLTNKTVPTYWKSTTLSDKPIGRLLIDLVISKMSRVDHFRVYIRFNQDNVTNGANIFGTNAVHPSSRVSQVWRIWQRQLKQLTNTCVWSYVLNITDISRNPGPDSCITACVSTVGLSLFNFNFFPALIAMHC